MIEVEPYKKRTDGKTLVRTYSTTGMLIERDGSLYDEAIDDPSMGYAYTETNSPCESANATEADYLTALERLGVTDD